ncbi:MAG TPA: rRNA maturation RNase YbeY [Candidatus Dojkabacteria bacterium]|nr:rRNA maturation RNase YbeY [Candidatus Dojkabacteria bacterium]
MEVKIFNWQELLRVSNIVGFSKDNLSLLLEKNFDVQNISCVNIIFVSSEYIKGLNKQFRKQDCVTDVLSFDPYGQGLPAEVYVCPEFVYANIGEKNFEDEILRNIIHGILHISGYNHNDGFDERSVELEEMFVMQENILQNIQNEINNGVGKSGRKIQKHKT